MKLKFRLIVGLLLTVCCLSTLSSVAHADTFNHNRIIDDGIFDNVNAMSAASINNFLNNFPQSCISPNNGFSAPDPIGYNPNQGYVYGGNVTAGQVIYDAAAAYGLNPQVILATLEKESSVVSGQASYRCQYINTSMGYDCPDSGSCPGNPATESGFSQQVIHATWFLKFGEQRAEGNVGWSVVKGGWDNSDDPKSCYSGPMTQGTWKRCPNGASASFDAYTTIDNASVHIDNGATAAFYWYTPHFHGNQLFTTYFTSWFGSPYSYDVYYGWRDLSLDSTGDTVQLPIILTQQPSRPVQVVYELTDTLRAKIIANESLFYTPDNWNSPVNHVITIQGLNPSNTTSQGLYVRVKQVISDDGRYSQQNPDNFSWQPVYWMQNSERAVYRLFNNRTSKHAYTASVSQKNNLLANGYTLENTPFYQCDSSLETPLMVSSDGSTVGSFNDTTIHGMFVTKLTEFFPSILISNSYGSVSAYLMRNSAYDSLLTTSSSEVNAAKQSGYSLIASFNACGANDRPVYRLNSASGDHFYTTNTGERDYASQHGYLNEGVGFYLGGSNAAAVYRLYSPSSGDHFYTTNTGERDYASQHGYLNEGVGFYLGGSNAAAVYRLYSPSSGDHFYTTNTGERDYASQHGYLNEGVGFTTP